MQCLLEIIMRQIVVYEAEDGKRFDLRAECEGYEKDGVQFFPVPRRIVTREFEPK